jgi:hypothetical protein
MDIGEIAQQFREVLPLLLSGIGLTLGYLYFRASRQLKILGVHEFVRSGVAITDQGFPLVLMQGMKLSCLQGVRAIFWLRSVGIGNLCGAPISPADFLKPLECEFDDAGGLLMARVLNARPPELDPHITTTNSGISIAPMLLNPGDRFTVLVLTQGRRLKCRARIVGTRIDRWTYDNGRKEAAQFVLMGYVAYLIIFFGLQLASDVQPVFRHLAGIIVWIGFLFRARYIQVIRPSRMATEWNDGPPELDYMDLWSNLHARYPALVAAPAESSGIKASESTVTV